MTVRYSGLEHFLATHVMCRVGNLITAFPKANSVFKKHIEKVLTAAKIYGKWLQAEYKKAQKRRLTDRGKKPDGKGWRLITCADWNWEDVFFETAEIQRHFWMRGEPKPNPLDYLCSMVCGKIRKTPRGISLLDYQYFLVACIYDSQQQAGQRRIYFSPEPEDSTLWDKELKDRICRRVWLVLVKGQRDIYAQVEITEEKIETALRAIEADLTGGSDNGRKSKPKARMSRPEYSKPLQTGQWADIFGVSPNTMRKLRDNRTYHFRQVSPRRWALPKSELPTEYLEKYRQHITQAPA